MIFGAVAVTFSVLDAVTKRRSISATSYFCSIEHARRAGFEPSRLLLPGEHIGEQCCWCEIPLDTEDSPGEDEEQPEPLPTHTERALHAYKPADLFTPTRVNSRWR